MGKQATIDEQANTPVQGAESAAETPEAGIILEAQTPEWVAEILASNAAVLQSNQLVIDSLEDFKEHSAEFVAQMVEEFAPKMDGKPINNTTEVSQFDEDADYEVAPGKSFRDSKDFTKEYTEGDVVTHLGAERLQTLLANGLIVEA